MSGRAVAVFQVPSSCGGAHGLAKLGLVWTLVFSVPRLSAHVGSADCPVGFFYSQRGRSQYSFRFSLVFATFMWIFRAFRRATISRSAFMGRRATAAPVVASKATVRMQQLPVFTNAMAEFKAEYPDFAKRGWGATVKAEVRLLDASVALCAARDWLIACLSERAILLGMG